MYVSVLVCYYHFCFLELVIMEIQPKTLQMRFETGSPFFALAGLELTEIHLFLPPEC